MFQGLRTVIYAAADLAKAKQWYAEVLGKPPYFDQPYYVGFNVGGFELGLQPAESELRPGAGGATAYWGVPDAKAAHERLLKLGAREQSPVRDVGEGILVGTYLDPFGNVVGIIQNPYFKAGE